MLNFLSFIVMFIIGFILFSFGILQTILSIFCSIPLTKKTVPMCKCMVDSGGIYKRITFTIILWTIVTSLIVLAVLFWGNSYTIWGFFFGLGFSFFLSINQWGLTDSNCVDYFSAYGKYYARRDLLDLGIIPEE